MLQIIYFKEILIIISQIENLQFQNQKEINYCNQINNSFIHININTYIDNMFRLNRLFKPSRNFLLNQHLFYKTQNEVASQALFRKNYYNFSSSQSSSQSGDNSQQSLNDFKSYIQKLKDEDSKQFNREEWDNKMMFKFLSSFIRRPYALEIIQEIELYVFSQQFQSCYKEEIVIVKYALFALHVWLVKNRLSQIMSLESFRINRSLDKLFEEYTKDIVYQFQDYFDKDVYSELIRIKRTLFYSLDDYFVYDYKDRDLSDIILDEILQGTYEGNDIDKESEEINNLINYIHEHRSYLSHFSASDLKEYKIFWGLDRCYKKDQN
ncbi:hypothetical protein TTHERM_00969640 (macronuclear) [Tetrahymena thermophila SB210]|uniref:Uncharacterized protein n=1 Tax=Tetrahymena thermophila (strain SB210) TaxID=312017 RepID=Q24DL0_TETTS|nr:hypothetical protein TTHERM_00969640 [Tetrahymena thermophila SB210]EAS05838.3 hypothetical protein TTHERM_00969640 [Tetrahymena thermophila SB210]|eukprot:XP_001026083.3 hypothetical protein TTHERM_00969640 [Tetrahymena thermophila SB210]